MVHHALQTLPWESHRGDSALLNDKPGLRAAALLALALAVPLVHAGEPVFPPQTTGYQLGRGYHVDSLGVTLGGYANFRYSDLEGQQANFTAQDLSLFVSGDLSTTWRFFSEAEFGNAFTITDHGWSNDDADFDVERLYLEHDLRPRLRVRVGKFLTPIGRWNLVHADPLVWTVSRPLVTAAPFARHAAGAEAIGSVPAGEGTLDYRVFVDDTRQLDPSQRSEQAFPDVTVQPNPRNAFDHGAGLRLLYRSFDDRLQLGFSAAHFRLQDLPNGKDLVAVDGYYTFKGWNSAARRCSGAATATRRATTTADTCRWWCRSTAASMPSPPTSASSPACSTTIRTSTALV